MKKAYVSQYEVGGRVKISGKWYELVDVSVGREYTNLRVKMPHGPEWWVVSNFVEFDSYEPPVKGEWLAHLGEWRYEYAFIERELQRKYGPPSGWVRKSEVAKVLEGLVTTGSAWAAFAKLGITPDMATCKDSLQVQEGGR